MAYCFDQACSAWGNHVLARLQDAAHKKDKQYNRLAAEQTRLLGSLLGEKPKFRSPSPT